MSPMRFGRSVGSFFIFLAVAAGSGVAYAQNYRSIPLGGRTATMGGAATAAGNDSAMPYLNPAGLAGLPSDVFGVSASVYSYQRRSYQHFFAPNGYTDAFGPYTQHYKIDDSGVLDSPSSIMYMSDFGNDDESIRHIIGFALVIPTGTRRSVIGKEDVDFPNLAAHSHNTFDLTVDETDYFFGPVYAISIDDSLRLATSLFVSYYHNAQSAEWKYELAALGGSQRSAMDLSTMLTCDAFSFAPVVGLQANLASDVWVGASFAPSSIHISAIQKTHGTREQITPDLETWTASQYVEDTTIKYAYQRNLPWRLNLGVAYDDRNAFSAAFDVTVYGKVASRYVRGISSSVVTASGETHRTYEEETGYSSRKKKMVIDYSAGIETSITDYLSFRAGAFTDFTPTDTNDDESLGIGVDAYDVYGLTLGLGLRFGSFDTTVGVVGRYGTGKYGVLDAESDTALSTPNVTLALVPSTFTSVSLVFSGIVTTEEAKQQILETLPDKAKPAAQWLMPSPPSSAPAGTPQPPSGTEPRRGPGGAAPAGAPPAVGPSSLPSNQPVQPGPKPPVPPTGGPNPSGQPSQLR